MIRAELKRRLCAAAVSMLGSLLIAGAGSTHAADEKPQLPAGAQLLAIEATPSTIELGNKFEYAQVLLTGKLASGEQIDVTRMATIHSPECAKITPTGLVRPAADGHGDLRIELAGQSLLV